MHAGGVDIGVDFRFPPDPHRPRSGDFPFDFPLNHDIARPFNVALGRNAAANDRSRLVLGLRN